MKKIIRIYAVLLAAAMLISLAACGTEQGENKEQTTVSDEREVKTRVAVQDGSSGLGLLKFKDDRSYAYDVEYYSDPQEIASLVEKGEADIAAVPLNLAAELYKKTNGGIQMIAVNTLGMLYVLSSDESVKSLEDLKGKTVYSSCPGAMPEYIVNYILDKNGIEDIDIQYKSTHSELASLAIDGKAETCILPGYFAAKVIAGNDKMKNIIVLTDEWNKVSEAELAMGCYIARKDFIESNPEILSEFLEFAEISTNYINDITRSLIFLIEGKYFETQEEAAWAVSGSGAVFITGEKMKNIAAPEFEILFNAYPASIGGEIPNDAFYS